MSTPGVYRNNECSSACKFLSKRDAGKIYNVIEDKQVFHICPPIFGSFIVHRNKKNDVS